MDSAVMEIIKNARERAKKYRKPAKGIRSWTQKEVYKGDIIETLNIVMATRGCGWYHASGCSMCGYSNEAAEEGADPNIAAQIEKIKEKYQGQPVMKLFTSGSFMDPKELTEKERTDLLNMAVQLKEDGLKRLVVESRPLYIKTYSIEDTVSKLQDIELEVAIGLESSNDKVLKGSINKGFKFSDYKQAVKVLTDAGSIPKTYFLLKPPFLSERDAQRDCLKTIKDVAELDIPQTISLNPLNVQAFTLVEHLYDRNEYRPPWLWSVIEVLKKGKDHLKEGQTLICHPAGAGTRRGAHNCKKCNSEFIEAIADFSLTNTLEALDNLECDCFGQYQADLVELL